MSFKQKVEKQFQKISDSMLASREIGSFATPHSSTRGRNTERVLINFLRKFLPQRFSISQGHIVSPRGDLTPQLDIIIHDETIYPVATVLESGEKIVFAHSVYAVISVKSIFFERSGVSQVNDMVNNLRPVYEMQKVINRSQNRWPLELRRRKVAISLFGFAFRNEEEDIITKLEGCSAADYLTALAILDASSSNGRGLYIIPYFYKTAGEGVEEDKYIDHRTKEKNTLLAFYRTLFNRLCEKDIVEPGDLKQTKGIIKRYKPWGAWGF